MHISVHGKGGGGARFSVYHLFSLFFKKRLDFYEVGDILTSWNWIPVNGIRFYAHSIGYFSKSARKPAKFKISLFCYQARKASMDHCVFVSLLDASLSSW